jgi:hypothetical protein
MDNPQVAQLADNLVKLSTEFKSQEAVQAAELKRAFKKKSHNDLARTVVYLMEVVGVSDMRLKTVQQENKDLREILELNNIKLGGQEDGKEDESKKEDNISTTSAENVTQDSAPSV